MKTEIPSIKSITLHGEMRTLYRGKDEAWFLHEDEAQQHRMGHTVAEALMLITGSGLPRFLFATTKKDSWPRASAREFRRYLEGGVHHL